MLNTDDDPFRAGAGRCRVTGAPYDHDMAEGIAITVISAAILAVVGWIIGLFSIPKHLREWDLTVKRAERDYLRWRKQASRDVAVELLKIDDDHARNLYDSETRVGERARVRREMQERLMDEITKLTRVREDATRKLRRVDRACLALRYRGEHGRVKALWTGLTESPTSLEDDVMDPVSHHLWGGDKS